MHETAAANGTGPTPIPATNGLVSLPYANPVFTSERLKELVAALEEPFDPTEIKWRVTNTTQIGSRNGPRFRGQMLAYADPRAYTDRLNELFTPSGWTRDYTVQLVQNFERKERGSAERTITAKIVVTCKVTICGFGAHTGLGEEWADNDNAGTAAEAQAFKRACSCFGLGRYLYDLEGQWMDLDEKKRPLDTPRLPDWARPKNGRCGNGHTPGRAPNRTAHAKTNGNVSGDERHRGGIFRDELLAQITALSEAVGFSLTKSVLKAVANVEDAAKIRDMAKLTAAFEKLQDTSRGVERLRRAIEKCGAPRYSALCRELNLASDSLDDIPDRATLRRILDILEPEAANGTPEPAGSDSRVMRNRRKFILVQIGQYAATGANGLRLIHLVEFQPAFQARHICTPPQSRANRRWNSKVVDARRIVAAHGDEGNGFSMT